MFLDCVELVQLWLGLLMTNGYECSKNGFENLGEASDETFTDDGETVNSGYFDGLTTDEAKLKVLEQLESIDKFGLDVTYKLRGWIISRHQYPG
jgi:leucyl-tRNA synthetase